MCQNDPNLVASKIINQDLMMYEFYKQVIKYDKPIFVGMYL